MSIGEQKITVRAAIEGFKQAAAQLKGAMQGFDRLSRMDQLPTSTGLQLPLVDFDPFAVASLTTEQASPIETFPMDGADHGSGTIPDAMRLRRRSPTAFTGRFDPPDQGRPSYPPHMAPDRSSAPPADPAALLKRARAGQAVPPLRHSTATARDDGGKKQPTGSEAVSVSHPGRIGPGGVNEEQYFNTRSPHTADASMAGQKRGVADASTNGPVIGPGAPLAATLKQLDDVTNRLLALNDRSKPNAPPSQGRPTAPGIADTRTAPMDIAGPAGKSALLAYSSPSGGSSAPGAYRGAFSSVPAEDTPALQSDAARGGGADGERSRIRPSMVLLDKLTTGLRRQAPTSSSAPAIAAAPQESPSTRVLAQASAMPPPSVRLPNKSLQGTMAATEALASFGPVLDAPELMPRQGHDPHLVAEHLTDLINDVLVSQARRHGVDV